MSVMKFLQCGRCFGNVRAGLDGGFRMVCVMVAALTAGCAAVAPDLSASQAQVPSGWQTPAGESNLELSDWWTRFGDPDLDRMIADVRTANLDLAAAVARIDGYAARYSIARAGLLPTIAAQGGVVADRQTERVRNPLHTEMSGNSTEIYQGGLSMSWELDVWGRVRQGMHAQRGEWDASIEDRRALMVMLQAQTAIEYINLRTAQRRIAYAEANIELQTETLSLVNERFDAGLTGELDVHQARMNLESTRATLPSLMSQKTQALNALCQLTGRLPGQLDELAHAGDIPCAEGLPATLPCDLLQARPDIRSARLGVESAAAAVGAARADLLPRLELTGSFFLLSDESDQFANEDALDYTAGPQLTWDLFTGGAKRGQVDDAKATARVAAVEYEQTLLEAFQECEDTLASYRNETERLTALRKTVASAEKSVELSKSLYVNGLVNFQNVLDMQRQLASYQDSLATSAGNSAAALVAVYRAFGGGWQNDGISE